MQETFAFASGELAVPLVFDFSDSDGLDRWTYVLVPPRLFHDWYFNGLRAAAEFELKRDPTDGWMIRLALWQDPAPGPRVDLALAGTGAWYPASKRPEGDDLRRVHAALCAWHPVKAEHAARLDAALAASTG